MLGVRSAAIYYRSRRARCFAAPVRRTPEHIRSDKYPDFVSNVICRLLKEAGVKTLFIAMGSPWSMAMSNLSMERFAMSC